MILTEALHTVFSSYTFELLFLSKADIHIIMNRILIYGIIVLKIETSVI